MMNIINEKIDLARETNYLDIPNLELTELFEIPEDLLEIKYLFINNNLIKNINFQKFNSLKVIDICDNPIKEINNLPINIEELSCNNCNLTYICDSDSLKMLFCENNKLEFLGNYKNLEDLIINNNLIKKINSYEKMLKLSCSNNPLEIIEEQKELLILECSEVLLCGKINFCKKLTKLFTNNCEISDISELNNLEEVDICNTKIKEIPFFLNLKYLITNEENILISENYKIKKYLFYNDKYNIIFN